MSNGRDDLATKFSNEQGSITVRLSYIKSCFRSFTEDRECYAALARVAAYNFVPHFSIPAVVTCTWCLISLKFMRCLDNPKGYPPLIRVGLGVNYLTISHQVNIGE